MYLFYISNSIPLLYLLYLHVCYSYRLNVCMYFCKLSYM